MESSRDIVMQSVNHKQPSRLAVDFGGTMCSGIHCTVVEALRKHYGLERHPVKIHEPYQMLGLIEDDLRQALGADVVNTFPLATFYGFAVEDWKEWRTPWGQDVLVPGKMNTTVNERGDVLMYPQGDVSVPPCAKMPEGGYFFDAITRQEDFDEDDLNAEDNLEEFKPYTDEDLRRLRQYAEEARATGCAVLAASPGTNLGDASAVPGPMLKRPKGIRDLEEWYVSLVARQDYVHEIFSRQIDIALKNLERLYATVGDLYDIVFVCGTDLGTQTSTFCSSETLESLYAPYYRKVNGWIHANTPWKTFKHCCGAVEGFIEQFADYGFDILNPVQCSATGMDPRLLKERHGDRIVFWGGGVDTQRVLPWGTPDEVREQVLERCAVFAPGGGFVFNTIHNIQARTPTANVVAMIDAIGEFNSAGK